MQENLLESLIPRQLTQMTKMSEYDGLRPTFFLVSIGRAPAFKLFANAHISRCFILFVVCRAVREALVEQQHIVGGLLANHW